MSKMSQPGNPPKTRQPPLGSVEHIWSLHHRSASITSPEFRTIFVSQIHRHCLVVLFGLIVNPLVGWAHPGHSTAAEDLAPSGLAHYLIEPVHSLPIAAAVAILMLASLAVWRGRFRNNVRPRVERVRS
jgi:hypothetical protein